MLVMAKTRVVQVLCQLWRLDLEFCTCLIIKQQHPGTGNNRKGGTEYRQTHGKHRRQFTTLTYQIQFCKTLVLQVTANASQISK